MIHRRIVMYLFLISGYSVFAQQVDISRFLDESIFDGLNPYEYQKINFKWDLPPSIQIAMNEGLTALDQNQGALAIAQFDQVIKKKPDFGPAYYYRSICRKNPWGLSFAETDMIKASSLLNIPECFIELGDIYYIKQNFIKAKNAYEKGLKLNPKLVIANYKLGCLFLTSNNFRVSEKYFEHCLEIDSGFAKAYLQLGLIKMRFAKSNYEASQFFSKAAKVDSTNVEAYFWRGFTGFMSRDRRNSLNDMSKTIELAPSNPYFRLIRGLLYIDLKEFDNAFNDLRKALNAYKVNEGASQFGQTALDKKIDLQNGSEYLNRVIYGYDDLSSEFLKAGFCYLLAGIYNHALENFNRASRINKTACDAYLKALTYEHMGQHNLAYDSYTEAIKLDPDIFDAYKKRAIYRSELKKWDEVFSDLNEMKRLQPGSIVINRLTGFLKYHSSEYKTSISELDIYLRHDSTDVEAIKVRADSKTRIKDYPGAIADFKKVISLTDDKKEIESLLIIISLHAGDTIAAVKSLAEFNSKYRLLDSEVWLAELYIDIRDFYKAQKNISLLEKTLKNNFANKKSLSYINYLKGKLKYKQGLYSDALEYINKSLAMYENDVFTFLRAKIYFSLNRGEDGKKDLFKLKEKGYKDAETFYSTYGLIN